MSLDGLYAELMDDPEALGYAIHIASGNDQAIAELLNEEIFVVKGVVLRGDFISWITGGIRAVIEDTALATQDPLRASALVLRDICRGAVESIDFSKPANVALLAAWRAAGKITVEQEAELLSLSEHLVSRAFILFKQSVTPADIAKVLR